MRNKKHLDPAASIVALFGGVAKTAAAANASTTAVQRWRWPAPEGCHGYIPRRHHAQLMRAARKMGVDLPPVAFIDPAQVPRVH